MKLARALLLCAIVSLWVAAAALGKGTIPKGYAYAAEVRVTVTYDATFTKDVTSDNPCTDDGGVDHHTPSSGHEQEKIDRTVLFKHITIPVVRASALGQAAARLALKPSVTDAGHVTAEHSSYDFSGSVYTTTDTNCPGFTIPFDCQGSITNDSRVEAWLISTDHGFEEEDWEIPVFSFELPNPTRCEAIGLGRAAPDDITVHLAVDASQAHPGWENVFLHRGTLDPRFYALSNPSKHKESWSGPVTGAKPCSDAVSCSQSVTGSYHVTIKRLFFYRTKHSYPK